MDEVTVGKADEKRLDQVKEQAREKINELKGKAQEGYHKASERVHETWEKVEGSSLKDVEDAVGSYVKENPGKCIAIAAAAGVLVGALLRGRRD
ncbi:DUF883 family protein [bacterium]|nr:DUF883 family protein [bacterium]